MATNSAANIKGTLTLAKGGTAATTLTDHGVLVGSGASATTALTVGTNGQVLICDSSDDPTFVTLASSGGTVEFTTGANTLNIETADLALEWSEETGTTKTIVVGEGYIANNASEIDFTLPATASVGDVFAITGKGAGKFKVTQNAGQTIHVIDESTTTGVDGYLTSDIQYGSMEFVCVVEDDDWKLRNVIGDYSLETVSPLSDWTQRTSSFSTTGINNLGYDGSSVWVTVGDGGKIATATDPTGTWTQRTSNMSGQNVNDVSYFSGDSKWIIVGSGGRNSISTSPTSTWTADSVNPYGTASTAYYVAFAGATFGIAGANFGGATGAKNTNPYSSSWFTQTTGFSTTTVRATNTAGTVLVGDSGKLSTGTFGGTFTIRTSSFGADHIYDVEYDGSTNYVAVGANGKLATATDPTGTWTQRTSSFDTTTIRGVAYYDGVWVAVGDSGKMATATDPTGSWVQQTSSFSTTQINKILNDGAGTWVAVGETGKLATATSL